MGERGTSQPEPAADGSDSGEPTSQTAPSSANRRSHERIEVRAWSVDCEAEDTFLYAAITNISELGIFVKTTEPLVPGTMLTLRFQPPGASEAFVLAGKVQWVNPVRPNDDNPNPGMGIRFTSLRAEDREKIVAVIHTITYLRDDPTP